MHRRLSCAGRALFVAALLAGSAAVAAATESYMQGARVLYSRYHRGGLVLSCALCHVKPAGGGRQSPYGRDYKAAGGGAQALQAIEYLDSDGDGVVNLDEIRTDSDPNDPSATPHPDDLNAARAKDWPIERVEATGFFPGASRVRGTSRVLSERAVERVAKALGRELTRYEQVPLVLQVKSRVAGAAREELAGAIYLVDTARPAGPMQVAVALLPARIVAGVAIAYHCEPGPAPGPESPDALGTGASPSADAPFTRQDRLIQFVGWSLDNEEQWAGKLAKLGEQDPDYVATYGAIANAIRTALWLAEETMPRVMADGPLGAPRRELAPDR